VPNAVDVLAYVLRIVWSLWSTGNLFKYSNGLWQATTTTVGEPSHIWAGCVPGENLPKLPLSATGSLHDEGFIQSKELGFKMHNVWSTEVMRWLESCMGWNFLSTPSHTCKPAPHPQEFEKFAPPAPHPHSSNSHLPRRPSQPAPAPHIFGLKPAPVRKLLKTHN